MPTFAIDKDVVFEKILKMFRPYGRGKFLERYKGSEVICGPCDRAMWGGDTNFPKEWLIEDFDFTEDEADWFINEVHRMSGD